MMNTMAETKPEQMAPAKIMEMTPQEFAVLVDIEVCEDCLLYPCNPITRAICGGAVRRDSEGE